MSLPPDQIAGAAKSAGFSGNDLVIAVAVALAESGGNPTATNRNNNGSTDYGLWQINSIHGSLLKQGDWKNPNDNARMAYSVWKGSGWRAWTVYKTGAYLKHMGIAATAARSPGVVSVGDSGGTVPIDNSLKSISDFTGMLISPTTWKRFAFFTGGMVAVLIGISMTKTGKDVRTTITETAKAAVEVATVVK